MAEASLTTYKSGLPTGEKARREITKAPAQGCDMHLPQLQGDQGPANLSRPMSSWLHLPGAGLGEQVLTTEPGHRAKDRKAGKLMRANSKTILGDSSGVAALWPPRVTSDPSSHVCPSSGPDTGRSLTLTPLSLETTDGGRAGYPSSQHYSPWELWTVVLSRVKR